MTPNPHATPTSHSVQSDPGVVLLVPTLNPGPEFQAWIAAVQSQTCQPGRVVVIDSGSTDGTLEACRAAGLEVHSVNRRDFDHGGTRQLGIDLFAHNATFAIWMTQDAVLNDPHAFAQLLEAFDDPQVAAAYGRQLPHHNATPIAGHARRFNYPDTSRTQTLADAPARGLKTCFLSDSFAAYRVNDLYSVGGFARRILCAEDMHLAARLLMAGKTIRYQAQACARHSHNYSWLQEFRRYFDTGAFHAHNGWMMKTFGGAQAEGRRYVRSELRHLASQAPWRLPDALARTAIKWLAYQMGHNADQWPIGLKKYMSMNKGYWE
jgi:rhamnosyltransferase